MKLLNKARTLLNKIINIGIHKNQSPVDIQRIQLSNLVILSTTLIELLSSLLSFYIGYPYFSFLFICIGCINISLFILVNKGYYQFVIIFFNVFCGFVICLVDYFFPEIGSNLFLIIASFFPLLTLRKRRLGYLIFIFWIIVFLISLYFNFRTDLNLLIDPAINQLLYLFSVFMLTTSVFLILAYYKRKNDNYALILENRNGVIEKQIELLEETDKVTRESINYAKHLQQAIIPSFDEINKYLPDNFLFNNPKETLSGDFCWFEHIDGCSYIAVADCTGHGVPGAMVSLVCSNALFRSVIEFDIYEPAKILDKTRELVIDTFSKNREAVKDGMDIALCRLKGNKLYYSGAYNPLWIIRGSEIIELKGDRQPIGKFVNSKPFISHQLDLQKGDVIYIFSDGFSDQFGGVKGKKYKAKNFKNFLLSIQNNTMEKQLIKLNQEFENWKGELLQVDDVCVVGVKIN